MKPEDYSDIVKVAARLLDISKANKEPGVVDFLNDTKRRWPDVFKKIQEYEASFR